MGDSSVVRHVRDPVSLSLLSQRRPSLACSIVLRSLAVRPSQVITRRISLPSANSIRSSGERGIIGPPMTCHTFARDCLNRIVLIRADAADLPIFAHETTASSRASCLRQADGDRAAAANCPRDDGRTTPPSRRASRRWPQLPQTALRTTVARHRVVRAASTVPPAS